MESYLQQAPCIYFSCTDEGRIIDVNDATCNKLGYTKEELTGNKADIIFPVATRIFLQTHFFPLLQMQGYAEEIFITLLTKEKEQLPVLINAKRNKVNDEYVNVYVGIVVPNRKKFEDELVAAKRAAESALHENKELVETRQQLQKHVEQVEQQIQLANKQNEELRQFNRVVTHDLQEPIRKLLMFVNMLAESEANENEKSIAGKIKRVADQMRSVIADLQQYIWLTETPGIFVETELNELLLAAQQEIKKEFPDAELVVKTDDLPSIQADAEQIQRLFYHLLSNVIRFKKEGDTAHANIRGTNLMLNSFRNVPDKYKYNEVIKLVITDKGIGFDSDRRNILFGLFKRLHATSGRGVGLALCKRIVENHHGTITIDSRKDEGTTVTIILPVKQVEAGHAEMAAKDQ